MAMTRVTDERPVISFFSALVYKTLSSPVHHENLTAEWHSRYHNLQINYGTRNHV
jgi:hypothetical protein